jgi:hypothetical protein
MFCIVFVLLQNKLFSSRKPATVLKAFSGADLSRARFLTRSSKTLDREHRWNNAGFAKARVEWGKKWKEKTFSAENSELEKKSG